MIRRPPRPKRTDTLFPYTTLFRSDDIGSAVHLAKAEPAAFEQARQRRIDRHAAADALALSAFDAVGRKDDLDLRFAAKRSEEHTSELQSLMRTSYAVFRLKKKQYT